MIYAIIIYYLVVIIHVESSEKLLYENFYELIPFFC